MLWTIARKELVEYVSSFRFLALFILTMLLIVTSVLVFSATYENAVKEYPHRVDQWVDENGKTYLNDVACRIGATVRQVPSPLAFCSGIAERVLPNQAIMAAHGLRIISRTSDPQKILSSTAHVDWAFVIMVLLSFAAGLLTYKGISGELRDGTLTLMFSNPLPRATVLLGKYLAALLVLVTALTIAMLGSLIVLHETETVRFMRDDWLRIGLFWLVSLFYLSCFVLIGLLCSVFTRSPLLSAVTFLFTWTCLVFVIPNLGGILTRQIGQTKTPLQMKKIAEAIPDQFPLHPGMSTVEEASVKLRREFTRERSLIEYVQSLIQQIQLVQHLTRVSPAATFTSAAETIAGGGTSRLMRFIDNAVRFREGFLQAMIEADKEDPNSDHVYIPTTCGGRNFSKQVVDLGPAKVFQDPPLFPVEGLQAALMDLALLIFYNGLLFLIAFWGFLQQDVAPIPEM